jgi:hypothetical protein
MSIQKIPSLRSLLLTENGNFWQRSGLGGAGESNRTTEEDAPATNEEPLFDSEVDDPQFEQFKNLSGTEHVGK